MGNSDVDLARTVSPYWVRDRDADDEANDGARIEALRAAVRSLAARVSRLEQTLDAIKGGAAPGKPPQRQASGRAPPTGEKLIRKGRLRVRS